MNARRLPDDVEALKALVAEQDAHIRALEHRVQVLSKALFAPSSERRPSKDFRMDPGQMHLLFPELVEAAERVADEKQVEGSVEVKASGEKKTPRRRKHFPPHLPVIRTTFELPAEQRRCTCGEALAEIGEDLSRELERLEIAVVHEIARKKYACKVCQEGVKIAPGPDRVIDKGILGVGFLAHVLVERFADHMPYNRLEAKYASEGFELSRSVLCESAGRCAELLKPIAEEIKKDALASGVVQTDDTPVVIQEGSDQRSRKSRVWVYRGLGGEVFFHSTESRGSAGPASVLRGYSGYLQADAYSVYDAIYKGGDVIEVGCMAHARRYFVEAEDSEPEFSKEAVDRFRELYGIERALELAGALALLRGRAARDRQQRGGTRAAHHRRGPQELDLLRQRARRRDRVRVRVIRSTRRSAKLVHPRALI
ncbi:MAG: IS66 family transposase [Planctomycetes bacterium]|nr:IS66 family transposase [Planctomycetota bacterium]